MLRFALVVFLFGPSLLMAREASAGPVTTLAAGADRVASLPDYAGPLDEAAERWEVEAWERIGWLDVGVELRNRYEFRDQDYRTAELIRDQAFFARSLAYLGVREVLDPFRFALELEDSRRSFSDQPESANESNHGELLQGYAELFVDDWFPEEPVSLRMGRMAFDSADRRLLARNRYRNTINAFDGLRLRIGQEESPFELEAYSLRPVVRDIRELDQSSSASQLHGVAGYFRQRSPELVWEPYWIHSEQTFAPVRSLHTVGVHLFGQFSGGAWDYDGSLAAQWGSRNEREHQAWAGHVEVGRSWRHPWKPRLAGWVNYASGGGDPEDARSGQFDPLYGASFSFYGFTGYFTWQNLIDPSVRLSIQPGRNLRCELIHRSMWLASSRDAWVRAERVDPAGESGVWIGQELDLKASYQISERLELEAVHAHFFPGRFVDENGGGEASAFTYLQARLRF